MARPAHRRSRRRALAATAAVALVALGGCGGDDGGSAGGCGPARRERLDGSSTVHVLPGAPEPEYLSDPPTSGPHELSPPVSGPLREPLSRPRQVGVLERGDVLLQYHPERVNADELAAVEALAGDGVVVAPNPDLDDVVVATAWLVKMRCDAVDADALADFAAEHRGGEITGNE